MLQKNGVKRFPNGVFSLQDDLRSGRPMEIGLDELKHALESKSDQSTRNIASKLWNWNPKNFKRFDARRNVTLLTL